MTPKKLYIIGNGFDLYHNIPSSLSQFKAFIKKEDSFVFNEVDKYLPVDEDWNNLEASDLAPIKESSFKVRTDIWTGPKYRGETDGQKALFSGADYREAARG